LRRGATDVPRIRAQISATPVLACALHRRGHPFASARMSRTLVAAAAQMGPIARDEPRPAVVRRLIALLQEAHARGARLVVFPELALTTFFPRYWMEDVAEIDAWFETEMPNPATLPLLEEASRLGVGFYLGYAERLCEAGRTRRFNTAILVDERGRIAGRYRKVHLPGHLERLPHAPYQHLEKRYFEPGDLGFPVWRTLGANIGMAICNDRRWPETYRVMGLQDAELVLLGYNTPLHTPWVPEYDPLAMFHNHLSMQAGAYQNSCFVVGTAKAGREEGCDLLAGSCIVAPSGEILAQTGTNGDEVIVAACRLDLCRINKQATFNFAAHRRIEHYGLIASRTGAMPPA
jgi:N-carbamoyl-D-amino-acid hydrolase